jgi:hypothetical protein
VCGVISAGLLRVLDAHVPPVEYLDTPQVKD